MVGLRAGFEQEQSRGESMSLRLYRSATKALTVLLISVVGSLAHAQQYAVGSDEGVSGEELWDACGFCHGPEGQGGPALDAPPLAAMEAWYVEQQLNAFKNGWRGMHPEDVSGLQMSIVSGMARNEATVKNIAAYISAMAPDPAPEMYRGAPAPSDRPFLWQSEYADLVHPDPANPQAGAPVYAAACAACHGVDGSGNEALRAPRLTSLPDWYIHRQLQYYKDGVRGAHPDDSWGATMAPFAQMLTDEQAIADVTAYIESL